MSRTLLFGRHYDRFERNLGLLFAVGILLATFTAYAVGAFQVSGSGIVLPEDATLVGFVAAAGIGARRGGLLFAWLAQVTAYAGFRIEWAASGLSSHSLAGKLGLLLDPTGVAVLAAASVSVGTAGFCVGHLGLSLSKRFKDRPRTSGQDDG